VAVTAVGTVAVVAVPAAAVTDVTAVVAVTAVTDVAVAAAVVGTDDDDVGGDVGLTYLFWNTALLDSVTALTSTILCSFCISRSFALLLHSIDALMSPI